MLVSPLRAPVSSITAFFSHGRHGREMSYVSIATGPYTSLEMRLTNRKAQTNLS
jgi:hypothetical protein